MICKWINSTYNVCPLFVLCSGKQYRAIVNGNINNFNANSDEIKHIDGLIEWDMKYNIIPKEHCEECEIYNNYSKIIIAKYL
jgi:hypothetical protein